MKTTGVRKLIKKTKKVHCLEMLKISPCSKMFKFKWDLLKMRDNSMETLCSYCEHNCNSKACEKISPGLVS